MSKEYPSYNVYKGLQKPLISKDLKASSYISVELVLLVLYFYVLLFLLWLLLCWGGITLVIVMFGGLGIHRNYKEKGFTGKINEKAYI